MKITWRLDSNSAFDVVIIGRGQPGTTAAGYPDGTWTFGGLKCLSPSGLWQVNANDIAVWDLLPKDWTVQGGGAAVFRGPSTSPVANPFLGYTPYTTGFVQFDIVWFARNTAVPSSAGWSGTMTYRVIQTDPADPSTWRWVSHYSGTGTPIS